MSALQIKCYLINEPSTDSIGKSNEIRRFPLAQTSTGFYDQLMEKIQQAYGPKILPQRDEVKTYWLDEENELVCFSTDPELQYAVDLQTAIRLSNNQQNKPYDNNVFKVYLVRKESCERKRSRSRRNKDKTSSSEETGDDAKVVHPGVVCDGCSNGIQGPRFKCNQCPDFDLCSSCKDKNLHSEHEFTKIDKPAFRCAWAGGRRGHSGLRHWRHHWRHHQQNQQNQQPGRFDSLQETLNHFMPHIANSIPIVHNQEQLKNVGEYLKNFLDPFGIDVSYYVDSLNRTAADSTAAAAAASATSAANAAAAAAAASAAAGGETKMDATSEEKKSEEKPKDEEKSAPMPTESEDSSKNVAQAISTAASAPVKDDLIDLKPTSESAAGSSTPSAFMKSPFEAAASALKSVLENPHAEGSKLKSTTNEQEYNGFNLVDMEKEIKFINCIEQLKSMGYSDDGGWLTRLVIAKEGNIHVILDCLHPSKN